MKLFTLIIIMLVFLRCPAHLVIPDRPEFEPTEQETEFLRSRKIGLIGFHTVESKSVSLSSDQSVKTPKYFQLIEYAGVNAVSPYGKYVRVTKGGRGSAVKWIFYPDPQRTAVPFLSFGEELRVMNTREVFPEVPESVKDLISKSYNLFNDNMYYEIKDLFIFLPEQEVQEGDPGFQLRKFDADYWIVGCIDPPEMRSESFLETLNILASIYTLGFLPVLRTGHEKKSSFAVFDRNFRLIQQFDYSEEFWSFSAIWVLWADTLVGDPYPPRTYQNEMNRLTKDVYQLLRNQN